MGNMIRLQDIADMAGVSRTTVSNVLHGNTKRVSQETIDRIKKILEETEYQPNIGSMMLTGKGSRIIGFVLGYDHIHGYPAVMDSFISELLAAVREEAERLGYYVMIIGGCVLDRVVEIASRWNVEGLIFIGFSEESYSMLRRRLNKKAVLIDTYTVKEEYDYQNVGIDDYNGGYQVGEYLRSCGHTDALFIAEETRVRADLKAGGSAGRGVRKSSGPCNERRWSGFKAAMEKDGGYCSIHRFVVVDQDLNIRRGQYEQMIPRFLEAGALAMASDYNAIEIINLLHDRGIRVPEQISVTGFDDCIYSEYIRPRLTTVHQNVSEKGRRAFRRLMRMIEGEDLPEMYVKSPVKLVIRDSVKDKRAQMVK